MQAASRIADITTTASRWYDVVLVKFILALSSNRGCSSGPDSPALR
jgi:hypothetical protein